MNTKIISIRLEEEDEKNIVCIMKEHRLPSTNSAILYSLNETAKRDSAEARKRELGGEPGEEATKPGHENV